MIDPTPEEISQRAAEISRENMQATRDDPGGVSHKHYLNGFVPRVVRAVIEQPKWARSGGID